MAQILPLSDGNDIPQCFSSAFRCATSEITKGEVEKFYQAGVRHFEIAELFGNGHIIVSTLGYWRQHNEGTVNSISSAEFANMGNAPTFSDNLVEVTKA